MLQWSVTTTGPCGISLMYPAHTFLEIDFQPLMVASLPNPSEMIWDLYFIRPLLYNEGVGSARLGKKHDAWL